MLGLTVVALQLSSTQFSPRLLRNFLRDRGNAGSPQRVHRNLRLLRCGSLHRRRGLPVLELRSIRGWLSVVQSRCSLSVWGMVVYFADHLVHSIQIDAINRRVERNTRRGDCPERRRRHVEEATPHVPEWAVPLLGRRPGYIQTVYPLLLLPLVSDGDVTICLRGSVSVSMWLRELSSAWVWAPSGGRPSPPAAEPL